jgi:hypothetical protein
VSAPLEDWLAAAPQPQRAGMRALAALGRRPRGRALLRRAAPADQLACALLAMGRYDEPAASRPLGWDAEAVVERGRALRREEGRP